jgi:cysteine sulfinate desulfinase/cysteine desulfurase-like protein
VLTAAGYSLEDARSGVRFSFSHLVSKKEAEEAASRVIAAVRKLVQ